MIKNFLVLLVLSVSCFGQGGLTRIQRFCEQGGRKAVTQGINSTNNVQESFLQCQVSVYTHGTQTLAHIFGDNLVTPTPIANPFTANDPSGSFGFYVGPGCYDIVTSGGSPTQFPQPFTYSDVCILTSGGAGPNITCADALNGSLAAWIDVNNLGCDTQSGTDFLGDLFGQSFRALGPTNGFIGLEGGGIDPILNESGFVYFVGADTVPSPYANKVPGTQGAVGQALGIASQTGNYNQLSWLNVGGIRVKVNGTDLLNTVGGVTPEANLIADSNITITNPSDGDIHIAASGGGSSCGTPNAQTDIWVDTAGNDSTGNGSNGNPYLHISRAIQDIPTIVCQRYVIHMKTPGTYDAGNGFRIDLSGHIWYGGGFGGYIGTANGGNSTGASYWPWEWQDKISNETRGSWVEIVGYDTPGDGASDPHNFIVDDAGGCSNIYGITIAGGNLILRGFQTGSLLAQHSTIQLAGVIFSGDCNALDIGYNSMVHLDASDRATGAWKNGSDYIYFQIENNTIFDLNYWLFLHDNSQISDQTAPWDSTGSFGEIKVIGSHDQWLNGLVIQGSSLDLTQSGIEFADGTSTVGRLVVDSSSYVTVNDLEIDGSGTGASLGGLGAVGVDNGSYLFANGMTISNVPQGLEIGENSSIRNNVPTFIGVTTPCKAIDTLTNYVNDGCSNARIGAHLQQVSVSHDLAGACTAAAATTCAISFLEAYVNAPVCTVTDTTNVVAAKVVTTTTGLTITTTLASSDTFNYICIGNPD